MITNFIAAFLVIIFPYVFYKVKSKKTFTKTYFKRLVFINLVSFLIVLVHSLGFVFFRVYAESVEFSSDRGMAFLAAALVTGMCTIGTGIATGQAASAALGAISENEALMGKSLIFVALAEGIAIYGLLISFMILAQV